MPINANIAMGYQPPKITQRDPMEEYGKMLQLQKLVTGNQDDMAARDALRSSGGDMAMALKNMISGGASLGAVTGLQKSIAENNEKAAQTKMHGAQTENFSAQARKHDVETATKRLETYGQGMRWLQQNPSPENAQLLADHYVQNGIIPKEQAQKGLDQINADPSPANIAKLAGMAFQSALSAKDQLPKLDAQDLGGARSYGAVDPITGMRTETGRQEITQSANSIATNETTRRGQNMTDARMREKNQIDRDSVGKIEWKQDTDGNWVALPKEVKDGSPVTPIKTTMPGKKEIQSGHAIDIIDEARKLLDKSTGSYIGAGVDLAGRAVGKATGGAVASAQLKALEGSLMMAQPRMEGPQSDKDVMLYRQMAGQIGDSTVPAPMKKAALDTIEQIHRKYAPNKATKPAAPGGLPPDIAALLNKHGGK